MRSAKRDVEDIANGILAGACGHQEDTHEAIAAPTLAQLQSMRKRFFVGWEAPQ